MTLTGRDLLQDADLSPAEVRAVLDLASELKRQRRSGEEDQRLVGRHLALIFEKTSTRTRVAFEVAMKDQGGHVTVLDPASSQIGHKESIADTARVLDRIFDGIEFRGAEQATVDALAAAAAVPVYNGLTDRWHPTQSLADALTMLEHATEPQAPLRYAYLGDARFNMGNSLLVMGALLGADVRIVAPRELWPDEEVQALAAQWAARTGARILVTDDVAAGVAGVEFVHTDVWVSMGEPESAWEERVDLLRPYRVDASLMAATGDPAAKFLHCLPAYHDTATGVGRRVAERFGLADGVEVSDGVFESPASVVFDQAENRLHTIKALLVATLT
jgi:ornithine carbamoyltransferase